MRTLILVVLGVVSGAAYAAPLQCPTSPGGTFALPTVVTVPTCPAGQVLTGNGSTLSCVTASVDASQPATGSTLGGIELNTDLGGTATAPQVTATHLAAPLPFAQGGLGGSPACVAGQYLTCSAGGCVCSTVPLSIVTGAPACGTEPVIANGTTWTCSTVQSQVNTQAASISNIETSIAALQSTVAPPATPTTLGLVQVTGDLTNTAYAPQVKSTHLLTPLPQAQGGTGAAALTCASGEHLTSNGSAYSCTTDTGSSYTGVTSDGSNGLTILGGVDVGSGSASRITITPLTAAQLQALADMVTWDMAYVSDGASASDCATGGGSYSHWCHYTGSAWATDAAAASAPDLITVPPTFSPVAGGYTGTQSVSLSSTTSGATICYTTTGSVPVGVDGTCTTGSTYSGAISVAASETLKAVATKAALLASPVASADYTITAGVGLASGTGLGTFLSGENPSGSGACSTTFSVSDTNTTLFLIGINDAAGNNDPGTTPPTISGGTLTWTNVAYARTSAGKLMGLWKTTSAAAVSSQTVTVTFSPAYMWGSCAVIALTGVGSLGTPVTLANENHGTANTVDVTTTGTGAWILSGGMSGTIVTPTYASGTGTIIDEEFANAADWFARKTGADAGTYTVGPTNTGGDGLVIAVEVKP